MANSTETNSYEVPDEEIKELSPSEYPLTLKISEVLRKTVDVIGRNGAWLIVPLILITVLDITARKLIWHDESGQPFGMQIWLVEYGGAIFSSTFLQELEWHFHTALWALVLGYGYIWNTHVRVDLVRETLKLDRKVWIELIGVTFFLIPYTVIVVWFACIFAYDSFMVGEISSSMVGLSHRWIIKSIMAAGLIIAFIAGISVWLQVFTVLRSPKNHRFPLMTMDWPEMEGSRMEGKERLDLSKAVDELERRAKAEGHLNVDKPA
jgi:TRAP-type mannitol/chloroaromatic compound transport system permease small subunit